MIVNGKEYKMWGQFIAEKEKWIGGQMHEISDSFPRAHNGNIPSTTIMDMRLRPNGDDSAYFEVIGKSYSCGSDVRYLGIVSGDEGWITFSGYGKHTWRIQEKQQPVLNAANETKYPIYRKFQNGCQFHKITASDCVISVHRAKYTPLNSYQIIVTANSMIINDCFDPEISMESNADEFEKVYNEAMWRLNKANTIV